METFFHALGAILISHYFLVVFAAGVAISPFYFRRFQDRSSLQSTAVSLGILGTFLGIFGGMLQFNANEIEKSIPVLLSGLQLAFLTPIVGIGVSLLIRLNIPPYHMDEESEEKIEEDQLVLIRKELVSIGKSLSGDEETTLLTQIQKLRTTMADKQDELNTSFKEFAAKMAENNMKALVEAVQKVMDDFNAKINDQIGDNFRRLNDGVEKMLEWQENYTKQVDKAVEVLEASSTSLEVSAEVMNATAKNAEDFKHIAEELKEQLEAMGAGMTGIKALADSLKDSGKGIRDEMEEITKQSIGALGTRLVSISEKLAEDYGRVQEAISRINRGA